MNKNTTLGCQYIGRSLFEVETVNNLSKITYDRAPFIYNFECVIYPADESFKKTKNKKTIILPNQLDENIIEHYKRIYLKNYKKKLKVINIERIPIIGSFTGNNNLLYTTPNNVMEVIPHSYPLINDQEVLRRIENNTVIDLIKQASNQVELQEVPTLTEFNQTYCNIEDFDVVVTNITMNLNTYKEVFFHNWFTKNDDCDINDILDIEIHGNGHIGYLFTSDIIIFDDLEDREILFTSPFTGTIIYDKDSQVDNSYSKFSASVGHHYNSAYMQYERNNEYNQFIEKNAIR